MNQDLQFDFHVDKLSKTITIGREFAAELELVWDAFTKPELIDQWEATPPLVSKTKYMDFVVGGQRFYAMGCPDEGENWIIQKYTSITPKSSFKFHNYFADKDENPQLPGSEWNYHFSEQNGVTKLSITIVNESLERMETMIRNGFQNRFALILSLLEKHLKNKYK
ncbi:SRPBCC domain-containing protein [Paradesertivirga mongoliensis]|uniref:SRPBCC domain-containing protein n=1 Tax=Paradesertivirga mongoliensis TaxID=2100740 RepID=A0ABW4ZMJ4_9SPHI|nr:SRPBCC domain-containing protein [Pedobacter mongoliensis]